MQSKVSQEILAISSSQLKNTSLEGYEPLLEHGHMIKLWIGNKYRSNCLESEEFILSNDIVIIEN
jgi:hypothetical protein